MKICVVSTPVFTCPPPGYSGLEQLAWQRAEGLAARGHQIALVAPDGSRCAGGEVINIGPAGAVSEHQAYGHYWPRLRDFDVVIDESWAKYSYTLKAEGVLKAPVLGVFHAPVNTMYQSWPPHYAGIGSVEKACPVCISQDQASHFEALFGRPARFCHNGVDTNFYAPMPGVRRSDRYLFLARFSSIKGADIAIRACREAGVGLDLVGDTSITNEPDYYHHCASQCDGRQIAMRGPATRGECVRWFSQAKALLHPNQRFREPFGLAPVEAQLCGAPVIAFRYGAMKETVDNGATGVLVDSYDQFLAAVKSLDPTEDNRAYCRQWASQFSVEKMIDRIEQLCTEAVDGGGW